MRGSDRIKIATSVPSLKEKTSIDLDEGRLDVVYWYIRFNIPLDPESVNHETMDVMDVEGYIMRTDISYSDKKHQIVVSPLDTYEQDVYYILNISEKVKSAKGQHLRSKIHIMFKLLGSQISEYKILRETVSLPKPKPRPKDYDQKHAPRLKVYSFEKNMIINKDAPLPYGSVDINLIIPVVGIVLVFISFFVSNPYLSGFSGLVALAGLFHIVFQLSGRKQRSQIAYNRGVYCFNKEQYAKANMLFRQALKENPDNELAEYATTKVSFYLK